MLFILTIFSIVISTAPLKCTDPSSKQLEELWLKGKIIYDKIKPFIQVIHEENGHQIPNEDLIIENFKFKVFSYNPKPVYGSSIDFYEKKYKIPIKTELIKSRCKFYYTFEKRYNRYPNVFVESKCSSKNSCGVQKSANRIRNYKCGELLSYELVLERGSLCDENNVYEWNIGIEPVHYSCDCILDKNFLVQIIDESN